MPWDEFLLLLLSLLLLRHSFPVFKGLVVFTAPDLWVP